MKIRNEYPMPPFSRRAALAGGLGLFAAVGLAACGAPSSTGGASSKVVLRWVAEAGPASWDPVVSGSGAQFRMLALAHASLTEIDDQGVAQPGLAAELEVQRQG